MVQMSRWLRRSSLLVRFFASWTLFQGTNAILLARPYTPSFVLKIALQDNNNNNMSSLPHQYQHHEPIDIEEREGRNDDESNHPNDTIVAANEPIWDPVAQIYNGGKVPENAAVPQMIQESNGYLRVFGYGSLCWNPGPAGESALAHSSVQRTTGQVRGYRRAWAQKSTDHRGLPQFPGIVCTLLTEAEFRKFRPPSACSPDADIEEAVTEGLIYKVPPDLVVECLEELDFREKGGYARDVIDVMEDNSGQTVQALLYRGTPDNPAFWPRALQDLPFAAAVIAAATGPSGENYVYLNRLDQFLEHASSCPTILEKFDDTFKLAAMIQTLRQDHRCRIHFLFGCGSNQHNQLLLKTADNGLVHNGDDALEFKEMVFCVTLDDEGPQGDIFDPMVDIFAGGGHSAMLSRSGRLYLCGWNDSGQLGISGGPLLESQKHASVQAAALPIPWLDALSEIRVETAALGFSHTLVVEKETGKLFAFGDNSRGQVDGTASNKDSSAMKGMLPVTPKFLQQERVTSVAAGLFHSAVILQSGELVTFGCGRFGQSLSSISDYNETTMACHGRWTPDDGSKLIRVSCGRRHTVALDDQGRVWTFGDNKYGQLGRQNAANQRDVKPGLVDVEASTYEYVGISCGWSHTIVLAKDVAAGSMRVFGWGRNDKGQLGIGSTVHQHHPVRLFELFENNIRTISCGSESTVIVDDLDMIWSCGWNEHGNLGTGGTADCLELRPVTGATITTTPGYVINDTRLAVGVGGAYVLAMRVQSNANLARSAHF